MYKICFYVPETHVEVVKTALFAVGAGKIGAYDSCSLQVLGQRQFRALEDSQPYLGQRGVLEVVAEYKVVMVFEDALIKKALEELLKTHPYEEPAYDVLKLVEL